MSSATTSALRAIALSCLLLPAAARVIWIPETFDPLYESSRLTPRQDSTCGGDASLNQCGGDFPTDFCCPGGTTCLALQTDASVTASICCPDGLECNTINTVQCDQSMQNATLVPFSQLHSEPTVELETCGDECCPMGYECRNNQCEALPASATPSDSVPPTAATSSSSSEDDATPPPAAGGGVVIGGADSSDSDFSGKSFAAGFVPGIAIGAFIAALLILLCLPRKKSSPRRSSNEKSPRDTLTDLGTSPDSYRPTLHGRSISEPVVDPRFVRNDFLRSSPPRDGAVNPIGNNVNIYSDAGRPITPGRTPKIKALFSHSPFMAPPTPSTPPTLPMPAHLKRGTLSFKISPVRALKKQKSMHSLRRLSQAANKSNSNRRPDLGRSDSQETILVQLTPDNAVPQVPPVPQQTTLGTSKYRPHDSVNTWISDSAADDDDTPDERQPAQLQPGAARYPVMNDAYGTPTRAPLHTGPSALGSPYTPTTQLGKTWKNNGMLGSDLRMAGGRGPGAVEDTRRDTTFSAMMERAGLRRSDLVPMPGRK